MVDYLLRIYEQRITNKEKKINLKMNYMYMYYEVNI